MTVLVVGEGLGVFDDVVDVYVRVAQAHDQPSLAPAQPCCPPTLLSLSGFTDNARESLGVAKDKQSFLTATAPPRLKRNNGK